MTVPMGHMVLYDRIDPALPQGQYRLRITTSVKLGGNDVDLDPDTRYFDVEGPRFQLAPNEVAAAFPPPNGHGPFSDALPHVALGRRTLPWERPLDPAGALPAAPAPAPGDPPAPAGPAPWMALLLFEDGEIAAPLKNVAVTDVLPPDVAATLAVPDGAKCDAVEVPQLLLQDLLPTVDEISLLSHVRQVNVDDRELSAGDSDGWFAVVMGNRIPEPNKKYRACLVSLEGRTDVLRVDPPDVDPGTVLGVGVGVPVGVVGVARAETARGAAPVRSGGAAAGPGGTVAGIGVDVGAIAAAPGASFVPNFVFRPPPVRLVLLYSWTFECSGIASFRELAQRVDIGMISETRTPFPVVADTGHIPVALRDRAGAAQTTWYRGPLVSYAITRDDRGPYHSADQCRRVSPDTGMEDISYAAAFEAGRLLAASDARLAQELMRWRRVDYRRSLELSLQSALVARFPSIGALATERLARLTGALVPPWVRPEVPRADLLELDKIRFAAGLLPDRLAEAWGIPSPLAAAMLGAQLGALAPPVERADAAGATLGPATIAGVRADTARLGRLTDLRGVLGRLTNGGLAR